MTDIVLDPGLWEALEAGAEGFIEEWCVAEGDHVTRRSDPRGHGHE